MKKIITLIGGAILLSACATTEEVPRFHQILFDTAEQNGRACIRQRDIRGYGVLERDVVSIDGGRQYYLATVLPGCQALQTSPSALFEGRFSEVCGGGRDRVVTEGDDHCTIRHIFKFESREAAFETHRAALERQDELREAAAE